MGDECPTSANIGRAGGRGGCQGVGGRDEHNFISQFPMDVLFCNYPSLSLLWLSNVKACMIWDLSVLMIVPPCWNLMMNNRDGVPVWVVV